MATRYLDIAIEAAKKAGELVMPYYLHGVASELKADQTPVTIADREAERIIIETIQKEFPDHRFLGEESGERVGSSELIWIIDPIDGTKNFIRRIPLFGIQIGLMQGSSLIAGVSNMPAIGELLSADRDGAYLVGERVAVSKISDLNQATISFAGLSRLFKSPAKDQVLELIDKTARVRAFGDCHAYHLVAAGRAEAVIEPAIKIWDIAALTAIIECAGGKCTDFDGGPIGLNTTMIVASNGLIHDQILEYLRT